MNQDFCVDIEELEEGIVYLTVHGYLDAHTFEEMETVVNELYEREKFKLIIDISDMPYISSAGAGVFIGAVGTSQDNDGNIVLLGPQPNVKEVFDLLGLSQIFTFCDSLAAAKRSFDT